MENVHRWQSLKAPSRTPRTDDTPSTITITTIDTTMVSASPALILATADATNLWGLAILRDTSPITTPTKTMAVAFLHHETTAQKTWLDSKARSGVYYYRTAAFEFTGRLGPWSAEATATVP
jgi:Na+-transporting NADH:ubiquinone oxidoreductase subunit NqrA